MKRHLFLASLLAAAVLSTPAAAENKGLTKAEVEAVVQEYISEHPQVLVDSLRKFQEKQRAEQEKLTKQKMVERRKDIFNDPAVPFIGNKKGDVTIVEFFDYHCGYCKRMLPTVTKLTGEDPKLKVVFHELPILSPDSETAAKAALAVYRIAPAKYFDFHSALMKSNGKFDEDMLTAEAKKLGIDEQRFKEEMNGKAVADALEKTKALGADLGIRGTPFFLVGNKSIAGAASEEDLKQAIAEARKEARKE